MRLSQLVVGAALVCVPGRLLAESDVVITVPGERSTTNIATAAGLAGGGALLGALGVYFHLSSRSLSDDVSATLFTGEVWTPDKDSKYDEANDDRTFAIVGYTVGGALMVSALVYYIVTDPPDETTLIHTQPTPIIVPQPGGAFLGGAWSF